MTRALKDVTTSANCDRRHFLAGTLTAIGGLALTRLPGVAAAAPAGADGDLARTYAAIREAVGDDTAQARQAAAGFRTWYADEGRSIQRYVVDAFDALDRGDPGSFALSSPASRRRLLHDWIGPPADRSPDATSQHRYLSAWAALDITARLSRFDGNYIPIPPQLA